MARSLHCSHRTQFSLCHPQALAASCLATFQPSLVSAQRFICQCAWAGRRMGTSVKRHVLGSRCRMPAALSYISVLSINVILKQQRQRMCWIAVSALYKCCVFTFRFAAAAERDKGPLQLHLLGSFLPSLWGGRHYIPKCMCSKLQQHRSQVRGRLPLPLPGGLQSHLCHCVRLGDERNLVRLFPSVLWSHFR